MIVEAEYLALVDALAFEDAARVMQPVVQDVQVGIAPGNQPAVVPDEAVAVVEGGGGGCGHAGLPCTGNLGRSAGRAAAGRRSGYFISQMTPTMYRWLRNKSTW